MNSHGAYREVAALPVEPVVKPEQRLTPPARSGKLDALERWLSSAGLFVLTGGLYLVGFCLVGWSGAVLLPDAYAWAQTGTWTSDTAWVLVELVSGSKLEAWLVTPQTWLGLHPIASWALDVPLWLGLLFAGLCSTWLAILFGEN